MPKNVRLLPSKVEFNVQSGQTILEAALSENIYLEYSCSNGQCGECKALLLEGSVDPAAGRSTSKVSLSEGEILTCSAIPKSDLLLVAKYCKELSDLKRKITPSKVDGFELIGDDVLIITLRLPPNAGFEYLPGQYIDITWNGSTRSYSLAGCKVIENKIELHIKKVEGGVLSEFLFTDLNEGQMFRFFGPLGTFFVRESDSPIIFMCTGTGFAPVKAMVEALIETGSKRGIHIYWGGRNADALYSEQPNHWARIHENVSYTPVLSRSTEEEFAFFEGYCQEAVVQQHKNLESFDVYACGSDSMIHSAKTLLVSKGLKIENFYSDAFLSSN